MKERQLGDILKILREKSGLTQRELARSVRATASHIAFIESGRRRPSHSLLFRLSRSLQDNQQELFLVAYPELGPLTLPHPRTDRRESTWRRFVACASRYSVTPEEMAVLRKISRLSKISSPDSYFWILNSIRQSFEED